MADTARLDALLRDDNALVRDYAERGLWALWSRTGDAAVERLMARGIEEMEAENYRAAIATFSEIVRRKPDFAEGWNKRATVRYLAKNYVASIADCRETLARNPNHFGALSGQGLCHLMLSEFREAADLFRRALAVHPHLESGRANLRTALNELVKWN